MSLARARLETLKVGDLKSFYKVVSVTLSVV